MHKETTRWVESLSDKQKKFLIKKEGYFTQMFFNQFTTNKLGELRKKYETNPDFLKLSTCSSQISEPGLNLNLNLDENFKF